MSEETISRGRGRRPAAKVAQEEDSALATATENALETISARVLDAEEATAQAVARATEALNAAVAAAEAQAHQAVERLAETRRAAEAAAEQIRTQIAAAKGEGEAAAGGLSRRVGEHMKTAEAALEAAARLAGERLETRVAQAVAEGERALQRVTEHFDTQAAAAQEAGRQTVTHARTALRGTEAAGVALLDGMTEVGRQLADFADTRIRHDIEMQSALMNCRSLGELSSVYARFVREAMAQYSAEASRTLRTGAAAALKSAERSRL